MPMRWPGRPAAAALACACVCFGPDVQAQADAGGWRGELRAHVEPRTANRLGPLAQAEALAPGRVAPPRSGAVLEAGVHGQAHGVAADLLLREEQLEGGASHGSARFDELHLSGGSDRWAFSAGRKIVSWDVGYGWRPNDVVQQEERRSLLGGTPQGRALLQLERFDADTAWSAVWVNPQHLHGAFDARSGADESALALRAYRRDGAVDWHGFARWGEHTRAGFGAAFAWVASDAVELHGSGRFAQAHDGWRFDGPAEAPAPANPWRIVTRGAAPQWLLGATWTGATQWSLLAEAWHDGAAPADAEWRAWQRRTDALAVAGRQAPAVLRPACAGNLAWQATPWQAQNLRRDNGFVRLSWQHEAWQPALDLLVTPADGGRVLTASLAWQGDRLRLDAALRQYGGPAGALLAQLPLRRAALLSVRYAF